MGNALDLQFRHGNSTGNCVGQDLENLRQKIFVNRIGAQMRWKHKNQAALEATSDGATSWVHVDVREYGVAFKKDKHYAVTQGGVDGEPLVDMARRAGLLTLLNCGGIASRVPERQTDRLPIDTIQLSDKGLEFVKGWEKFGPKPYNDSKGYCTVGYGHLLDYTSCENMASDPSSEYHAFKNGITEQRATDILRSDVEKAVDEVRKYIHVPVYQQEFDALVSLAFNAGSFRKFPNLVSKINTKDYVGGCNEFADITNGGTNGLVTRRQAEMKMFRNNVYDSTH
jgi:GH24 family phage-related lysozyme (muramidase)